MNQNDFTKELEQAIQLTLKNINRKFYHEYDLEYQLAHALRPLLESDKYKMNKLKDISMEFPFSKTIVNAKQTPHIDMLFEFEDGRAVPIELKHIYSEEDDNRGDVLYSFIHDIWRLEHFFKNPQNVEGGYIKSTFGYALFVTACERIYDPDNEKWSCEGCNENPCKRAHCINDKNPRYYPLRLYNDKNGIKALQHGSYYWRCRDKEDGERLEEFIKDKNKKDSMRRQELILEKDYSVQWKYVENAANPEIKYHYLLIPVIAG